MMVVTTKNESALSTYNLIYRECILNKMTRFFPMIHGSEASLSFTFLGLEDFWD